jgi:hypothetical protein
VTVEAVAPDRQPDPVGGSVSPEQAWQAFATAIAGRPRVRVSRDRGRTYPARSEEDLDPGRLPSAPAAVLLYDASAAARCLAADFDVARGGQGQVDADAAAFTALISACGGRSFADVSPNGGRHVYVVWSRPRPITELRPLMRALCGLYPSLDPTPMLNPAAGCIRPPGARHRSGGHQRLTTALPELTAVLAEPNGPAVWAGLLDRLSPDLGNDLEPHDPEPPEVLPCTRVGAGARLSERLERIARTGDWEATRYASASEARQAVVTAAAAAGWALPDLAARVERGSWPGLAGLYARYTRRNRRAALARDWRKAHAYLSRVRTASNSPTRVMSHTGGTRGGHDLRSQQPAAGDEAEYRWIRAWWNATRAVERIRWADRSGLSKRLVLRALGAMGQRRGTRIVDVGRRSLALACGLDDSTVGAVLRALREEPDPVIELLEPGTGERADRYVLRIPEAGLHAAAWRAWRPGRIEAIPAVFRELGAARALVYESLTEAPLPRRGVSHAAALPAGTVDEALRVLAEHGLAEKVPGQGWRRGPTAPDRLAHTLGVSELVDRVVERYRAERAAWRALLERLALRHRPSLVSHGFTEPFAWPEQLSPPPPTDPDEHAYDKVLNGLDTDPAHAIEREALRLLTAAFGPITTAGVEADDPRYGTFAVPRHDSAETA